MARFAAFLRGINLGNRRMRMQELRAACEDLGFPGAGTLLASGNVQLESAAPLEEIREVLETGLEERFGKHFEGDVLWTRRNWNTVRKATR